MGGTPTAILPYGEGGISMNLQPGKPAAEGTGPVIFFGVSDIEAASARAAAAGGKVLSPVIDIPVGRMCYCADPDGNSFGTFRFAA
jgi:predicted enzyme related to lactoylglutathione lyase